MTSDNWIGRRVDEYEVLSPLGKGGMAQVYLAIDSRLKRHVALKVVGAAQIADAGALRRFEREAQAIAQLDHPHIVRLYRFGESDGFHYMAMQYVAGSDLYAVLASYRAEKSFMPLSEVSRVIREIGEALDYAHEKGVVHRDVKPANIIVNGEGRTVLADFGLVLLEESGTTAGEAFGTPHYMAPEQVVSSAAAGALSDLYSLGVILFEMVAGRLPFDHANAVEVALKQVNEAPPSPSDLRPEIGEPLAAVILRALAKEPQERFTTGRELADALEAALPALPESPVTTPFLSIPDRVTAHFERKGGLLPAAIARPGPAAGTTAPLPSALRALLPATLRSLLPLARPQTILFGSGCVLLAVLALLALSAVYGVAGGRWGGLMPASSGTPANSGASANSGNYTIFLPLISEGEAEPSPESRLPKGESARSAPATGTVAVLLVEAASFLWTYGRSR